MRRNSEEPGPLLRKFDLDCARLGVVRDTMVRSLSSNMASALQRQAVAVGSLQRDLHMLQADLETVKEGLGEQLSSIAAGSKPHWKFVPAQRAATSTERNAAQALQRRWRRRPSHTHRWHYSTPAERQAVMQGTKESQSLRYPEIAPGAWQAWPGVRPGYHVDQPEAEPPVRSHSVA